MLVIQATAGRCCAGKTITPQWARTSLRSPLPTLALPAALAPPSPSGPQLRCRHDLAAMLARGSYPILSYPILSYPILSYPPPILSASYPAPVLYRQPRDLAPIPNLPSPVA